MDNKTQANHSYSFDEYLLWRENVDYYFDDSFLQEVITCFAQGEKEEIDREMRRFSPLVSQRWRILSEIIARPEKRPALQQYDAHQHRIDEIIRPHETEVLEREIFSEAIFSSKTSPWMKLLKMFLIYQNGEACIACPLTCTEGLVAILQRYADSPQLQAILAHCREGRDGHFAIGAQYLSEIQGGSDVPANLVQAVREGDSWRLYGNKFFCSATHADYALVTAKPEGSDRVGLFLVPSWMEQSGVVPKRNHFTIARIKEKLGTRELTTAEIDFDGALAYQVGPLERGLANVVGIVLTMSRLTVGLSAAASMVRAAREVRKYAQFRQAFGHSVADFPMVKQQLDTLDHWAKRTLAGAFMLYRDFMTYVEPGFEATISQMDDEMLRKKRFNCREMVMLQKITAAYDCTDHLRLAVSILGGHGVMEDFSALPRLFRDSVVNELWEGPRNVLLDQIYRDIMKARQWYKPGDFIASLLEGAAVYRRNELINEIESILANAPEDMKNASPELCRRWDQFCHDLWHAFQDAAYELVVTKREQ